MLNQFETFLALLKNQFLETSIGISTIIVIIALYLKFHLNQNVTAICHKRMIISTPPEITFLGIGFMISQMSRVDMNTYTQLLPVGIALLVLSIQYTAVKDLENNINGPLDGKNKRKIAYMYIASIILYLSAIAGGV